MVVVELSSKVALPAAEVALLVMVGPLVLANPRWLSLAVVFLETAFSLFSPKVDSPIWALLFLASVLPVMILSAASALVVSSSAALALMVAELQLVTGKTQW